MQNEMKTPSVASGKTQHICEKCKAELDPREMERSLYICPRCGKYNRVPARLRIAWLLDEGSFFEHCAELISGNPLDFPEYEEKLRASIEGSGERESVITGRGRIGGYPVCFFVMEAGFMMGSMGTVVGDKLAALFEYATAQRMPVIGYTLSGGARMQEGTLALLQMAKVSGAAKLHSDAGLFYLVCATDPTMGGTTASFAMLGDVIISEPGAQIGFVGKRVIEQVMGEKLPDHFQSAEFQLENGFLDGIVPRGEQREYLIRMLRMNGDAR
jgi:acetyl-CoA carboxylase carboxyl transferase subunit beta